MNLINSSFFILKHARNRITLPAAHQLLRNKEKIRFIAAYPRSGSTWLRTMLATLMDERVSGNPLSMERIIPALSIPNAKKINRRLDNPIVFSHAPFLPGVQRAIYLVRDGRDSITSFYHFTVTLRGLNLSFSEWLNLYQRGLLGQRWDENVTSWLQNGRKNLGENLLVIKYETLKAQSEESLQQIANFLHIPHSPERIRQAIQDTSFENMQKMEKQRRPDTQDPNQRVYRTGKSGEWKTQFDEKQHSEFMKIAGPAMRLAQYN